jgi:hypothetical protein
MKDINYNEVDKGLQNIIRDLVSNNYSFNDIKYELCFSELEDEAVITGDYTDLRDAIDTAFLHISNELKNQFDIEIEATHKDFGYLTDTECGDFYHTVIAKIQEKYAPQYLV